MIRSFTDEEIEKLFFTGMSRKFGRIARVALCKLNILDNTRRLDDLKCPAGNRLEVLRGDRLGQYSIRVNDQYRICFRWQNGEAWDVEIVDYR